MKVFYCFILLLITSATLGQDVVGTWEVVECRIESNTLHPVHVQTLEENRRRMRISLFKRGMMEVKSTHVETGTGTFIFEPDAKLLQLTYNTPLGPREFNFITDRVDDDLTLNEDTGEYKAFWKLSKISIPGK